MFTIPIPSNRSAAILALALGLLTFPAVSQTVPPTAAFTVPTSANVGDAGFTLVLTGGGFVSGSTIYWGTQALATTVLSANQLSAAVSTQMLAVSGQIMISATTPTGLRSNSLPFTITATALSVTTATLPSAQVGVAYTQALTAAGGTPPYVWSSVGTAPAGLAVSSAGQITGTPTGNGAFTLAVRVVDAAQQSATKSLSLSVTASAISISNPEVFQAVTEGVSYTQRLTVVNGVAPFRWSAGPGLPPGISLDAATGVLSGTPSAHGAYSFSIQVTDNNSVSASKTFSLTVQAAPLAITTVAPLFTGTVGSAYSQIFTAAGGAHPYAWTMRPPVPGLALDRATGALAGTPEQVGTSNITIQATDSAGATISKDFSLVIEQPQLRITNNASLPSGTVDVTYQQRFLASGGRQPYTWSISSGAVPGLTLDPATGVLSGTPSSGGAFTITIAVRDAAATTSSRAFNLTITPGSLKLTPLSSTLRNTVGQPFSTSLSAAGGAPPYSWSANGLPEGLEIDPATGMVAGTFHAVGSFLFTVRVTDAARATVTELVSVDVIAPALPALTVPEISDIVKAADQASVRLQLSAPYSLPITGQLSLGFAPETGAGDPAVQFSTGGRIVDFRLPAGSTTAEFPAGSIGLQTGTVAGTITLTARLLYEGVTLTPNPVSVKTIRVDRSAPAITAATFTRNGSNIEIRITGYSSSREMLQGVFRFRANSGSTLSSSEVNVSLEETFGRWFRDSASTQFGSQFTFTQQFAIQGDINAVTPVSVSLSNRVGSTTADIRQ